METKDKILIVEDDETIAAFLIAVLEANGFDTIRASLGREAVTLISSHCPDLVLLDLSLPDMDGMEILAGLRKWSTLPVIVVSARGRERDKVIALDMGADDYLTKPFGPGELLARIRAALRHVRTAAGGEVGRTGVYRCGDLEVDCVRRRVRINGEDIHLTQSEYRILSLLTRHAGKVLTPMTLSCASCGGPPRAAATRSCASTWRISAGRSKRIPPNQNTYSPRSVSATA